MIVGALFVASSEVQSRPMGTNSKTNKASANGNEMWQSENIDRNKSTLHLEPGFEFEQFDKEFLDALNSLEKHHHFERSTPKTLVQVDTPKFSFISYFQRENEKGREGILLLIDAHPNDSKPPKLLHYYLLLQSAWDYAFSTSYLDKFLAVLCGHIIPSFQSLVDLLIIHDYEGIIGMAFLMGQNHRMQHVLLKFGRQGFNKMDYAALYPMVLPGKEKTPIKPWKEHRILHFAEKKNDSQQNELELLIFLTKESEWPKSFLDKIKKILFIEGLHSNLIEKLAILFLGNKLVLDRSDSFLRQRYPATSTYILRGMTIDSILESISKKHQKNYFMQLLEELNHFTTILIPEP